MAKILIESLDNGYVIETSYKDINEETGQYKWVVDSEVVISEPDEPSEYEKDLFKTNDPSKVAIGRLLLNISDLFLSDDRYGKENISITFDKKGSKAI